MATETTYTSLRKNLARLLDQVGDQQETVIVRRRGARDVALIPAGELAGLIETAHLLRSPRIARRLLGALRRADHGKAKPATIAELRREILGETKNELIFFRPAIIIDSPDDRLPSSQPA
jgi:antitoxin YefM